MGLFKISKNNLEGIEEAPFKLEREIQNLTEQNLETVLNLQFVCSEFSVDNYRIDSLAFDLVNNSFVIIEYKRSKNYSVIDQGYAYLSLMLNHKADFILEYNEQLNSKLKRNSIDWSQSKVMFVSPMFTSYQKDAIRFKDLPIELWEVKRYANDTVSYNQIRPFNTNESIQTVSQKNSVVSSVSKEVKVYSEEDHLKDLPDSIHELYQSFRSAVVDFGEVEVKPKKIYIGFWNQRLFVSAAFQKKNIKIWINLKYGELDDPKNLARDISTIGHHGVGDYEVRLSSEDELDDVLYLVKQSFKKK